MSTVEYSNVEVHTRLAVHPVATQEPSGLMMTNPAASDRRATSEWTGLEWVDKHGHGCVVVLVSRRRVILDPRQPAHPFLASWAGILALLGQGRCPWKVLAAGTVHARAIGEVSQRRINLLRVLPKVNSGVARKVTDVQSAVSRTIERRTGCQSAVL